MPLFSILDVVALGFFIVAWGGYAYMTERSRSAAAASTRS